MKKEWHIENPLKCPMVRAINAIGGRWKPIILHILSVGTVRFGELRKKIPPVTQKMLTQQLRELESDGLIIRRVYPQVPPKVEYSLSEKGKSLSPILDLLYDWGSSIKERTPKTK